MVTDGVGIVADGAPQAWDDGHARTVEDARLYGESILSLEEKHKHCAGAATKVGAE